MTRTTAALGRRKSWMTSLLVAMSLSLSPAVQAFGTPCNVCGDIRVMTKPASRFNDQTRERSCEDWKLRGESGIMEPTLCANFANSNQFRTTCGCEFPAPTSAPTSLTRVEGEVILLLRNVTKAMAHNIVRDYQDFMVMFFDKHFQTVSDWPGLVENWMVTLTQQERWFIKEGRRDRDRDRDRDRQLRTTQRRLPAQLVPIMTRLLVTAHVSQMLGKATFEEQLKKTVQERPIELREFLQESNKVVPTVFFKHILEIGAFGPDEEITFPRIKQVHNAGSLSTGGGSGTGNEEDGSLSKGAIAGIAAAAGFVVILCLLTSWVYLRSRKTKEKERKLEEERQSIKAQQSVRYSHASRGFEFAPGTPENIRSSFVSSGNSDAGGDKFDGTSSIRSSGCTPTRYRSQRLGNLRSSSTRIIGADGKTLSVLSGESSRNFSQSLRASMLRSSGFQESALPRNLEDEKYGARTPKFQDELPEGDEEEDQDEEYHDEPPPQPVPAATTPAKQASPPDFFHTDKEQKEPERFEEGGGNEVVQNEKVEEEEAEEKQEAPARKPAADHRNAPAAAASAGHATTREVVAPPGKLGIVIETTLEGPIIHKINPNSPLLGLVFEGDLITAIDNVDCRAMSASAITALMVRTADHSRTMAVRSDHA